MAKSIRANASKTFPGQINVRVGTQQLKPITIEEATTLEVVLHHATIEARKLNGLDEEESMSIKSGVALQASEPSKLPTSPAARMHALAELMKLPASLFGLPWKRWSKKRRLEVIKLLIPQDVVEE